jgi:hypothetical protein
MMSRERYAEREENGVVVGFPAARPFWVKRTCSG